VGQQGRTITLVFILRQEWRSQLHPRFLGEVGVHSVSCSLRRMFAQKQM
jgi:hypothetical protein